MYEKALIKLSKTYENKIKKIHLNNFLNTLFLKRKNILMENASSNALNIIKAKSFQITEQSLMILNDYESRLYNDEILISDFTNLGPELKVNDFASAQVKISMLEKLKDTQNRKLISSKKQIDGLKKEVRQLYQSQQEHLNLVRIQNINLETFRTILLQILRKVDIFPESKQDECKNLLANKKIDQLAEIFKNTKISDPVNLRIGI